MPFESEARRYADDSRKSVGAAQPIQFYDTATGDLVLELAGATLPEGELELSERLLRSQSRYRNAREQTSQVLGIEHSAIPLEGTVDSYNDEAGRRISAADFEERISSVFGNGRRLILVWGVFVFRGYLDEKSSFISDADSFRYRLTFQPTRTRRAKASAGIPGRAKSDVFDLSVAEREVASARNWVEKLRGLSPFTLESLEGITLIENSISDVASLANVGLGLVSRTSSSVARLERLVLGSIRAAGAIPDRARDAALAEATEDETLSTMSESRSRIRVTGAARATDAGLRAVLRFLRERSSGKTVERTHLVREGETLFSIAFLHYGTAEDWRRIYDANDLASIELEKGSRLKIPRR